MTAEEHPAFMGRLLDGTAVFGFSNPTILERFEVEQNAERPSGNGLHPDDPGPPESAAPDDVQEPALDAEKADKADKPPADTKKKPADPRNSVAAQLVRRARANYTLGVTDTGEPFGVNANRPHIALMLRGGRTGLRAELSSSYFEDHKSVASQQALTDACCVLEGFAAQENPQQVYQRVGEQGGVVYVDTGDNAGHVIRIGDGAWSITDSAPVLFRRTKLTAAMPTPIAGGDLSRLWEFVPVDKADRPLILAWLIHALISPDTAHTILALIAEHGSVKSNSTKCLVNLVDPNPAPLRQAPRDQTAWVTAASACWVVGLDNLSGTLPLWLSDSLCRASTGDGDVRRALYTDSDVSVFAFRRVVVFNGVDVHVTQGDLADRLLRVELPRVHNRRDDASVAASWRAAHPAILGGLLDLAAGVHDASVTVPRLPRMADFATVLAAIDKIHDTNGLDRYRDSVKRAAADTLDTAFIAELMRRRPTLTDRTSGEIRAALKPDDKDWTPPRGWPKNARAVTDQLTRHAPALRMQGWSIEHDDGRNHRNVTQWTITPPERSPKTDSHDSRDPQDDNNRSSDGIDGCESGCESGASQDRGPDSRDSRDSQDELPLSCEYEVARDASQEYDPSLVGSAFSPGQCPECGDDLTRDNATGTGMCVDCLLVANDEENPA